MAQIVEGRPARKARLFARSVPHLIDRVAPQRVADRIGEDHPAGPRTVAGQVSGNDRAYDFRHRHRADPAMLLGGPNSGAPPRTATS
jgi:hypothetical protein